MPYIRSAMRGITDRQKEYAVHLIEKAGFETTEEAMRVVVKTSKVLPTMSARQADSIGRAFGNGKRFLSDLSIDEASSLISCLKSSAYSKYKYDEAEVDRILAEETGKTCVMCGEAISMQRLKQAPKATTCTQECSKERRVQWWNEEGEKMMEQKKHREHLESLAGSLMPVGEDTAEFWERFAP